MALMIRDHQNAALGRNIEYTRISYAIDKHGHKPQRPPHKSIPDTVEEGTLRHGERLRLGIGD
jgi:hypothetical protein